MESKLDNIGKAGHAYPTIEGAFRSPDDPLVSGRSFMFARKVSVRLKSDTACQFIQKMENEIIPLLRKQKGFLDELSLISQSGREIYAYSF
jgi:hypothetical protein